MFLPLIINSSVLLSTFSKFFDILNKGKVVAAVRDSESGFIPEVALKENLGCPSKGEAVLVANVFGEASYRAHNTGGD